MKKLSFLLLTGAFVLNILSCGGSSSPTPNPANDNSYKGVYKGVLTGAGLTGHFWVDAYNTDDTNLTTSVTFTDASFDNVAGTKTTDGTNYLYTFSSNGCVLILEVTATGSVVSDGTSLTCSGGVGTITVVADKATSTSDVGVWEGTETNTDGSCTESGIWNVIIKGTTITGTVAVTTSDCGIVGLDGAITGTVNGSSITCSVEDGSVTATGTISDSSSSGTWTGGGFTGTFEGSKTL